MAARSDGDRYGEMVLYEFPKQELIYGPSQITLMGRPDAIPEDQQPGQLAPALERDGIKYVSMAAYKQGENPAIMRAPMVVKWLQYFMGGIQWGELD